MVNEQQIEFLDKIDDVETRKQLQEIFLEAVAGADEYERVVVERLQAFRAAHASTDLAELAAILYEGLVEIGEEMGDMQMVHFAVECRDALIG